MHYYKNEVALLSPAKINLHLSVGKRRNDGYHTILSVFQQISIFDTIMLRKTSNSSSCFIHGMPDLPLRDNIMYKAYKAFASQTGVAAGIDIAIEKKIPRKAGLGGGSTNAASILTGLNELFGTGLSSVQLAAIGASVGSDVPFFCYSAPAAVVTGRGEEVRPVFPARVFHGLLVCAPFEIDTSQAYRWIDEMKRESRDDIRDQIVHQYKHEDPQNWGFYNSFQPVINHFFPAASTIIDQIRASGAIYTSLSGSGSALFGLFRTEEEVRTAYNSIDKNMGTVWKIKTLERSPVAVVQ